MAASINTQAFLEKAEELTMAILVAVKRDDWSTAEALEAQRKSVLVALDERLSLGTKAERDVLERIASGNEQIKKHVGQRHTEIGLLLNAFEKSAETLSK